MHKFIYAIIISIFGMSANADDSPICDPLGTSFAFCQAKQNMFFIPIDEDMREKMRGDLLNRKNIHGQEIQIPDEQVGLLSSLNEIDDPNKHFASTIFEIVDTDPLSDKDLLIAPVLKDTGEMRFFEFKEKIISGPGDTTHYYSFFLQIPSKNPDYIPKPIHSEVFTTHKYFPEIRTLLIMESLFRDTRAMRFMEQEKPDENLDDYRGDFEVHKNAHTEMFLSIRRRPQ